MSNTCIDYELIDYELIDHLGIFKQFVIQNICQEQSRIHCRIKYFSNMHKFQVIIKWLSKICWTSLIALFYNFPLSFSHSKNIRMSTLITIIITS